jgi:hypothetical protein
MVLCGVACGSGDGTADGGAGADRAARADANPQLGRVCDLGMSFPAIPTTTTIKAPALECPGGICILPMAEKDPQGTGPLCSALCRSNEDCLTDSSAGAASGCRTGFVCAWPTAVGPFCCQRMCVCRDFVVEPVGGFSTPAACMAPSDCANVP